MSAKYALLLVAASNALSARPVTQTPVQLWPCAPGSPFQTWTPALFLGGLNGVPATGLVLNILGYSNASGAQLNVWTVTPGDPAQAFSFSPATGAVVSAMNGLCAGTPNSTGVLPAGTAVVQVPLFAGNNATAWAYDGATGLLRWRGDATLCLDAGTPAPSCAAGAAAPFCNASLPPAARAALLLAEMLPVEKAAMLAASNNGVPRLGVPPLRYGEALHGVLSGCGAAAPPDAGGFASTGCPTSFPTGLALGASYNRSLWRAVGATIGREARALFNQGHIAQSMLFTPDVNPFRDPRWGRGMEVPSEDPYAAGEYAAEYVRGFQGEDGDFLTSVAMPKHFAAHDQDGNFGPHDRTHFCAPVTRRALVEYFWPPFRAAVERGRAGGLMCAASGYGIDGAPGQAACARADVNEGVVRAQWGFEGAMVTDGDGVGYLWTSYGHGALNCGDGATGPTSAVGVGLRGGVDVELGETLNNFALAALADGNATVADVDRALSRTLPFLFKLGLLDDPARVPAAALGPADVDTAAARALAAEAAAQAVVLLRNGAALLPLDAAALRRVAVVGPNADAWEAMLANYHGSSESAPAHTPLAAIRALAAARGGALAVASAPGCATVLCPDDGGFAAALAAAAGADVVIFVGGGAPWRGGAGAFNATEGEEFDRSDIALPGMQEALIEALLGAGRPVVVVLMRGGPIGLSPALLADARLATLVDVCYPGELGGDGLADVLFGAVAPSGRLATTVYAPSFVATRNITDYDFTSGEGVTHLWYTGAPQFAFGFGLSTTTWDLQWFGGAPPDADVDAGAWASGLHGPPPYAVNATNTGARTSDLSLLAFLSSAAPGEPRQQLFDFDRAAAVAPGETRTLVFSVPPAVAARVGADGEAALAPGDLTVRIGAPGERMLAATLRVRGARAVVAPAPFAGA